jgi:hypothetical protein
MVDIERVVTLDELVERVPERMIREAERNRTQIEEISPVPTHSPLKETHIVSKELSKAQRIRNFLEANPEARNKDVVEALSAYSVTAADVANVKSITKRSTAKQAVVHREPRRPRPEPSESTAMSSAGPSITLPELEAGVAFVKAAGSIMRAKHLLIIIEQIKAC